MALKLPNGGANETAPKKKATAAEAATTAAVPVNDMVVNQILWFS